MVSKDDIIRIARKKKLPLGTIEKDFVLTYVLKKIYESSLKYGLVFKGGTALHKLYLHKRLSIDLDFTEVEPLEADELKAVIEDKEIDSKIKEVKRTRDSTRVVLSYNSVLEHKNNIILDISRRERPILGLMIRKLESPYFPKIDILTFQLEELVAEKLRAIIQRNKPRDYLDIYYVLNKKGFDVKKAVRIAKQKLKATNDTFDSKRIVDELDIVKSLWEAELRMVVPTAPDFDRVMRKLKKEIVQST